MPIANFMMFRDDKDGNKSVLSLMKKVYQAEKHYIGYNFDLNAEV